MKKTNRLQKVSSFFTLVVFGVVVFSAAACAATLPMPPDTADRTYLGLPDAETFVLADIKTPVIIAEFFSYYCNLCRKEAGLVNELYSLIAGDTSLNKKIKMVGIGIGNSLKDVSAFRKKYTVAFPLVPDKKVAVMKSMNVKSTPTFLVLKKKPDGSLEKVLMKSGPLGNPKAFLDEVRKQAGL